MRSLNEAVGLTRHAGADAALLRHAEMALGFALPLDHREVLTWSNGIEAFHGYFRLFGLYSDDRVDAICWNEPGCWKFAWENRCLPYWCFGETAFGDQYAYETEALKRSGASPVYLVNAYSMTPEILAPSFAEFFERDFLRNAKEPYDEMISLARRKLGELEIGSLLAYVPSIALTGVEDIETLMRKPRRAAMICNGDTAIQLDAGPEDGSVSRIEVYEDQEGRSRLRLIWN